MGINQEKRNLEIVWGILDNTCKSVDNAFHDIYNTADIPEDIKERIKMIDFSAIKNVRYDLEKMIEEKERIKEDLESMRLIADHTIDNVTFNTVLKSYPKEK